LDTIEKTAQFIMGTYKRLDVVFEKGEGLYLFDTYGNKYLDFLAGIAVNILGYSHPVIVKSIKEQADKLIHISNLYHIKEQADLAEFLINKSVLDKAFFCNSGAEANEAAIKIARLYGKGERYKIIAMENSFHGRTMATLSATGQKKYHKGFEPMLEGFDFAKFNDFDDFKSKVDDSVCAVMLELVQGEGGINLASRQYIRDLYSYCKENDILLMIDEVQTGMCRSGKLFAYEYYGIEPDVVTLSKALGGGVPIGALLAKNKVADYFKPSTHGSTFGGNPFVSSVSLSVLEFVTEENFLAHIEDMGNYFLDGLKNIAKDKKQIESVGGIGLILGIHFKNPKDADSLVQKAFKRKILIGKAGDSSVRFEPPLIVEKHHIDEVLNFLKEVL